MHTPKRRLGCKNSTGTVLKQDLENMSWKISILERILYTNEMMSRTVVMHSND